MYLLVNQVKEAMGSYISHRAEHTTSKAYYTLKEDLVTSAKQKAFALGGNAIIEAKLAITKGSLESTQRLLFHII